MNDRIDELTKQLHTGATKTFDKLKDLEYTCLNLRISASHLSDKNEANAINVIAQDLFNNLKELENATYFVKESAKEIGTLNKDEEMEL